MSISFQTPCLGYQVHEPPHLKAKRGVLVRTMKSGGRCVLVPNMAACMLHIDRGGLVLLTLMQDRS